MAPFDASITFGSTTDLEATTRFYGEVLGLPLALDQGGCRIWKVRRGAYLGFCAREVAACEGLVLTLVADDVDGWERRLRAHGVRIEKPAQANPTYAIYHLFARDPSGYLVEIQRFDDPAWDRTA